MFKNKPFRISKNKIPISFFNKTNNLNKIEKVIPKNNYVPPQANINNLAEENGDNENNEVNYENQHSNLIEEMENNF